MRKLKNIIAIPLIGGLTAAQTKSITDTKCLMLMHRILNMIINTNRILPGIQKVISNLFR